MRWFRKCEWNAEEEDLVEVLCINTVLLRIFSLQTCDILLSLKICHLI